FWVPSREVCTSATETPPIVARAAKSSRNAAAMFVISSNPRTPLSCTQRHACSPRNFGQPCATANASASSSVIARRSGMPLFDSNHEVRRERRARVDALERRLDDRAHAGLVGGRPRLGGVELERE